MTTIHFDGYYLTVPESQVTNGNDLQLLREQLLAPPHMLQGNRVITAPLAAVVEVVLETHILIEAAGGLVFNPDGALLMIRRRGFWDLPKGKLEPGESPGQGAVREVEEETGVDGIQLGGHIQDTYHAYYMYEQYVLKRTWWFEMKVTHMPMLIAQTEEDITEVKWILPAEIPGVLHQTYPNIRTILNKYYGL